MEKPSQSPKDNPRNSTRGKVGNRQQGLAAFRATDVKSVFTLRFTCTNQGSSGVFIYPRTYDSSNAMPKGIVVCLAGQLFCSQGFEVFGQGRSGVHVFDQEKDLVELGQCLRRALQGF